MGRCRYGWKISGNYNGTGREQTDPGKEYQGLLWEANRQKDARFAVVRYGNVAGSRGSVIPFFRQIIADGGGELPITDYRMTRFWISLEQGVELALKALAQASGGETFISKIPSFKVTDLAQAMLPGLQDAGSRDTRGREAA